MAKSTKTKETPVEETKDQTAEEVKAPDKSPNAVVKAAAGLNVRVGPHKSYPSMGILADGTQVEILELPGGVRVPGWYLVTAPDHTGWVDADFIALPEAE